MKTILVILTFCVMCILGTQIATVAMVPDDAVYEYTAVVVGDQGFVEAMNRHGQDGWKAVNARRVQHPSGVYAYEMILMRVVE